MLGYGAQLLTQQPVRHTVITVNCVCKQLEQTVRNERTVSNASLHSQTFTTFFPLSLIHNFVPSQESLPSPLAWNTELRVLTLSDQSQVQLSQLLTTYGFINTDIMNQTTRRIYVCRWEDDIKKNAKK
jgi:hypothetical protein